MLYGLLNIVLSSSLKLVLHLQQGWAMYIDLQSDVYTATLTLHISSMSNDKTMTSVLYVSHAGSLQYSIAHLLY